MKKLIKNEIYGSVNSVHIHCSPQKVNIYSYCLMNSNRNTPKTRENRKKKEQKRRVENAAVNNTQTVFGLRVCASTFTISAFSFLFFFSQAAVVDQIFHEQCSDALFMDPQITLFINFFIKNGSHSTIYTFKNYFATVFSVSAKISSIQTDPIIEFLLC